ncbi:hypothetical protein H4R35_000193 [Dimargaris xerosporica]|nr:hypothetical protein H4R35_000193 [Dimargaris xerosporica]
MLDALATAWNTPSRRTPWWRPTPGPSFPHQWSAIALVGHGNIGRPTTAPARSETPDRPPAGPQQSTPAVAHQWWQRISPPPQAWSQVFKTIVWCLGLLARFLRTTGNLATRSLSLGDLRQANGLLFGPHFTLEESNFDGTQDTTPAGHSIPLRDTLPGPACQTFSLLARVRPSSIQVILGSHLPRDCDQHGDAATHGADTLDGKAPIVTPSSPTTAVDASTTSTDFYLQFTVDTIVPCLMRLHWLAQEIWTYTPDPVLSFETRPSHGGRIQAFRLPAGPGQRVQVLIDPCCLFTDGNQRSLASITDLAYPTPEPSPKFTLSAAQVEPDTADPFEGYAPISRDPSTPLAMHNPAALGSAYPLVISVEPLTAHTPFSGQLTYVAVQSVPTDLAEPGRPLAYHAQCLKQKIHFAGRYYLLQDMFGLHDPLSEMGCGDLSPAAHTMSGHRCSVTAEPSVGGTARGSMYSVRTMPLLPLDRTLFIPEITLPWPDLAPSLNAEAQAVGYDFQLWMDAAAPSRVPLTNQQSWDQCLAASPSSLTRPPSGHATSLTRPRSATLARSCVVCLVEPRTTMVLPCRHLCLCLGCAKALLNQQVTRCPLCRMTLDTLLHLSPTLLKPDG